MTGFTYDDESYADADLDAWIVEVGSLLREQREGESGKSKSRRGGTSPGEAEAARRARQPKRRGRATRQTQAEDRWLRPPAWARSLVLTVCAEADAPLPRLSWRHRDRPTSSGVTRQAAGAVSVVAGHDPSTNG
jgi:hypothetical protein